MPQCPFNWIPKSNDKGYFVFYKDENCTIPEVALERNDVRIELPGGKVERKEYSQT